MRPFCHWILFGAVYMLAAPAVASIETVIGNVSTAVPGHVSVQVRLLNPGSTSLRIARLAPLDAKLTVGGKTMPIVLHCSSAAEPVDVAAGGFATSLFDASLPDERPAGDGAVLTLSNGSSFAFRLPSDKRAVPDPASPGAPTVAEASLSSLSADTGNAFLHDLSAYDPIYAVYGPGTNSDAKIQISFKYQLFGRGDGSDGASVLDGLHFAYTQRLYWDLGQKSSPFRNIDFLPVPERPVGGGSTLGARFGVRHESNGRDGLASRSLNTLYLQPVATLPVGRYRLSIGPRIWTFVGDLSDNPDVRRYRGNTGLFAEFGADDGLRVTTNSRFNFGSGKGSIDATASYPLSRWAPALNLYIFGQGFTGYGENLLDYNRHQTRLRLGLGIVR
jgi:phospholipase A1